MNLSSIPDGWSISLDTTPPVLTRNTCADGMATLLGNATRLAVATEASSHPSGLQALYAQPWVWAGPGLGNLDECDVGDGTLYSCLAGGIRRDAPLAFASVCVAVQCNAHDLSADDFVGALSRIAMTADSALSQEYITLVDRIQQLNRFLGTGWICGEFQVPWSRFSIPYLLCSLALIICVVISTLGKRRDRKNKSHETIQLLEDQYSGDEEKKQESTSIHSYSSKTDRNAFAYHPFWSAFDLSENLRRITTQRSPETAMLDGIRVGSIFWIVLGHVMAIVSSTGPGYSNPTNFLPPHGLTTTWLGQLLFSSRLAVDSFLCISGFLVVHVLLRKLPPQQDPKIWRRYVKTLPQLFLARVVRILPLYASCLAFYTQIAPHMGSGPFWYQWLALLKPCHDYGWTNFLFINNFVPWDLAITDTCFYHSWYLAVDMQLFLVAPLLVCYYQARPVTARRATLVLWFLSVFVTFYLSWARHWSINTFDGAAVARFDVEAYAKPHVRAQAYLTGMYVAFVLPDLSYRNPWRRKHTICLTTTLIVMAFVAFCTVSGAYARRPCHYSEWPQRDQCGSEWPQYLTLFYTSFSRTLWSGGIGVLMHLFLGRQGNIVGDILSWRCWTPLSHLSFGVYLIHPIVIFIWQLSSHEKEVFSLLTFGMNYLSVCVVSYVSALIAALTVELPCTTLWKNHIEHRHQFQGNRPPSSSSASYGTIEIDEYGTK